MDAWRGKERKERKKEMRGGSAAVLPASYWWCLLEERERGFSVCSFAVLVLPHLS